MKKNIIWLFLICTTIHPKVDIKLSSQKGLGLFTELFKVVATLIHYEPKGINSIAVDWSSPKFSYKDGYDNNINGWNLFFEPIPLPETDPDDTITEGKWAPEAHELHSICSGQWLKYDINLSYRLYVKSIMDKYIKIKPFILNKVEQFYETTMKSHVCIGVHVRHASAVADRASLEEYAQEIDKLIRKHPTEKIKIFVASDSYVPIRYMKKRYGQKMVHYNAPRKEGTDDPIYNTPNAKLGFNAGVDALVDWLLLAKCDYSIHISSSIPVFVSLYNPYIKDIFLPKGRPFKECLTNETSQNPYIHLINQ